MVAMDDQRFTNYMRATTQRENVIASSLARHTKTILNLTPTDGPTEHPKAFDFVLFQPDTGWSKRIEMQCDFWPHTGLEGNLLFELRQGAQKGKLHYCKADSFLYHIPALETIFLMDWPKLKSLILRRHKEGSLVIKEHVDRSATGTPALPTTVALIPIPEVRSHLGPDSFKIFSYDDLNIPTKCITKTYEPI